MSAFSVHTSPFDLDAADFEHFFRGLGHRVKINAIERKSIGTGQIGENVRFKFDFANADAGAPRTLVGKFPSADETSLAAARMLGHYRREVMVYRTFPKVAGVITPDALHTDYDEATNRFQLIMEDMAPSEQGDQLKGCSADMAKIALKAAAHMHAAHWNDAALDGYDWVQNSAAAPAPLLGADAMTGLWQGFKDRYGAQVAAEDIEVGEAYVAAIPRWSNAWDGPVTLTHNDFRLDNMLFAPAPGARKPVAVVDWQTASKGAAANDVAYFIGAGLTREERPKHEQALLRYYHDALTGNGVTGYSFDDLYRDYRWHCFYGMSVAFGASMLVKQTARGDEMFLTMLRRHAAQARDNNALVLLP